MSNNKIHALTQITQNIQEGFCDTLAMYLTNIKNPDNDICKIFATVREKGNNREPSGKIKKYYVQDIFKYITTDSQSQESILNLAIDNSLEIARLQLSHSNFKEDLIIDLIEALKKKELKFNNDIDLIKKIKEELTVYNPAQNNISAINSINEKIICMRNISLQDSSKNFKFK